MPLWAGVYRPLLRLASAGSSRCVVARSFVLQRANMKTPSKLNKHENRLWYRLPGCMLGHCRNSRSCCCCCCCGNGTRVRTLLGQCAFQLALQVPGTKSMESLQCPWEERFHCSIHNSSNNNNDNGSAMFMCSAMWQCNSGNSLVSNVGRAIRVDTTGPLWALGHVTWDMGR